MVRLFFHFPISDREYIQRVRRHPPSSLLPLIAQVSSQLPTKADWEQDWVRLNRHRRVKGLYRPWLCGYWSGPPSATPTVESPRWG